MCPLLRFHTSFNIITFTVQSGQMSTDDVDQPVRVYVGKNGIEVKGNYNL